MELPQNNNERVIAKGKMIELVESTVISGGKEHTFERARRAPGVRLLIQTPDGGFLLNREKRHELGLQEDLRLPGGKVFDRLEDFKAFTATGGDMQSKAREAAINEAMQEVGIRPTEIEFVGISKNGATMEWDLYYFVVKKYDEVGKSLQDTEAAEIIGSTKVTREELAEKALSGAMSEDRSVAMILKYLHK
jgi:8-oxo-dGTP pyrophosphatase MutT (NUDIX family)